MKAFAVGDRERPDVVAPRPPDAEELERLRCSAVLIDGLPGGAVPPQNHVAADRPGVVGARGGHGDEGLVNRQGLTAEAAFAAAAGIVHRHRHVGVLIRSRGVESARVERRIGRGPGLRTVGTVRARDERRRSEPCEGAEERRATSDCERHGAFSVKCNIVP